jgi:hypothetical protein
VHDWRPVRELSKRDRVLVLLEQWQAIHDPLTSPHGSPGDGDGTPHMPPVSRHRSVRELERQLRDLREREPRLYRHLRAFFGAETTIRPRTRARRRPNGKRDTVTVREQVRLLPSWLDADLVRHGVSTVTLRFRGECVLPDELGECLPEYIRRADKA